MSTAGFANYKDSASSPRISHLTISAISQVKNGLFQILFVVEALVLFFMRNYFCSSSGRRRVSKIFCLISLMIC